jgi:hypothetical protein
MILLPLFIDIGYMCVCVCVCVLGLGIFIQITERELQRSVAEGDKLTQP